MSLHLFGIRHHGPGSARSLLAAFEQLRPDCVLVEGPPEGDALLALLADPDLEPPVALLVYAPQLPGRAAFYPFALFSPEWQALSWAIRHEVPVRFIDLPQAHRLALPEASEAPEEQEEAEATQTALPTLRHDPLAVVARTAGFADGERWWERLVEERPDDQALFAAIAELMAELRRDAEAAGLVTDPLEAQREAWMRRQLRAAQKEGYERIAVVVGAWHLPALNGEYKVKEDNALLKGLPTVKSSAAWVPWSHGRLAAAGYGAGIESPGWYHHLFSTARQVTSRWLIHAAALLRESGQETSPAHAVEAVRLADSLAALRQRPLPGLPELNEAILTVLCHGDPLIFSRIEQPLLIGERLGRVPESAPTTPLAQDLTAQQKRLRLKVEAQWRDLTLDLRNATDLARSQLLRRLRLLAVHWGTGGERSRGSGTFKEQWRIAWEPTLALALVEAGAWGNDVASAATRRAIDQAQAAESIPTLTALVREVLYADLAEAMGPVLAALDARSAVAGDITHLMAGLPDLAQLLRYGDVRNTATDRVVQVVRDMTVRITAGLGLAVSHLAEEAVTPLLQLLVEVDAAIALLDDEALLLGWHTALRQLLGRAGVHGLLQGRACRLLLDRGALDGEEVGRQLALATSIGTPPEEAAGWIDGFIGDSGQLLVHDDHLWTLVDSWVSGIAPERFDEVLPLLRRTFSRLPAGERAALGRRVRGSSGLPSPQAAVALDNSRAAAALPLLKQLLGWEVSPHD